MRCPTHNIDLIAQTTRYGVRYRCPAFECTVACWSGSTSTPADDETRRLRHSCHEVFDPLWRGPKRKRRWKDRNHAYSWLGRFMRVPGDEAHIGMFDKEQCLRLLDALGGTKCQTKPS